MCTPREPTLNAAAGVVTEGPVLPGGAAADGGVGSSHLPLPPRVRELRQGSFCFPRMGILGALRGLCSPGHPVQDQGPARGGKQLSLSGQIRHCSTGVPLGR